MKQEATTKSRANLYLVLDILPGASHNDILHAYNRAKMTYSNGSLASYSLIEEESGEGILEEIERAFETLGNPARRREYDLSMGYSTWNDETSSRSDHSSRGQASPSIMSKDLRASDGTSFSSSTPKGARLEVVHSQSSAKSHPAPLPAAYEPNPEFELKITECIDVDGAFLKAVRIYRRLTADQLASRCKLSASHVLAVEDEDSPKLHHPVYLRGHVHMMCQVLDLPNPENLAKKYVQRMQTQGKTAKAAF